MSLVDKALESKKNKSKLRVSEFGSDSEYDEFGLKIRNTPDYIVARILKLHPELYIDRDTGFLYEDGKCIPQVQMSLYRLSEYSRPIPASHQQIVWLRLEGLVPSLDRSKVKVVPGLVWDREKGELVENGDTGRQI